MAVSETLKGTLHFRSCLAHPRLTADMRFGSCRASTQIATQLLISANVVRNATYILYKINVTLWKTQNFHY